MGGNWFEDIMRALKFGGQEGGMNMPIPAAETAGVDFGPSLGQAMTSPSQLGRRADMTPTDNVLTAAGPAASPEQLAWNQPIQAQRDRALSTNYADTVSGGPGPGWAPGFSPKRMEEQFPNVATNAAFAPDYHVDADMANTMIGPGRMGGGGGDASGIPVGALPAKDPGLLAKVTGVFGDLFGGGGGGAGAGAKKDTTLAQRVLDSAGGVAEQLRTIPHPTDPPGPTGVGPTGRTSQIGATGTPTDFQTVSAPGGPTGGSIVKAGPYNIPQDPNAASQVFGSGNGPANVDVVPGGLDTGGAPQSGMKDYNPWMEALKAFAGTAGERGLLPGLGAAMRAGPAASRQNQWMESHRGILDQMAPGDPDRSRILAQMASPAGKYHQRNSNANLGGYWVENGSGKRDGYARQWPKAGGPPGGWYKRHERSEARIAHELKGTAEAETARGYRNFIMNRKTSRDARKWLEGDKAIGDITIRKVLEKSPYESYEHWKETLGPLLAFAYPDSGTQQAAPGWMQTLLNEVLDIPLPNTASAREKSDSQKAFIKSEDINELGGEEMTRKQQDVLNELRRGK